MRSSTEPRLLRWLSCIYGLMLRAYPSVFREEYGREMVLVFDSHARDVMQKSGSLALVPFMLRIVWDWLTTALHEGDEIETRRNGSPPRRTPDSAIQEETMQARIRRIYVLTVVAVALFVVLRSTVLARSGSIPLPMLIPIVLLALAAIFGPLGVRPRLAKMRLVTAGFLWRNIKYAFLISLIIAAVLTPKGDLWNQAVFAAPMVGLYLVSILIVWIVQPRLQATNEADR
jgi:hypothetical protein